MMAVIRLRGDHVSTWKWYELFEARVLAMAQRTGFPSGVHMALDLRNRFFNTPLSSGYWLFTTDGEQQISGHVCGWLTVNLGLVEIFFFQAEGPFSLEQKRTWYEDCSAWIDEVNSYRGKLTYLPDGPPISGCSLVTPHDANVMSEWIERLGFEKPQTMTILKFRRKAATVHMNGKLEVPAGLR